MKEKIVLVGAGSAMFTRGLVADLIRSGMAADLALVDIAPEALEVAEKLCRKMIEARKADIRLSASVDRRDVLPGATSVVCTVGVGGRRAWEQDVLIPRKHGIYAPVGDTVMPGGTSRALRMIPAMIAIAEDVLDLAPNALFFNYGNPMTPVCRAIRKATGAPAVGLCHGVLAVGHYLAKALGLPPGEFQYTAVGINHLTWFVEARARGEDVMPRLRDVARQRSARQISAEGLGTRFAEAGTAGRGETPADDNPFSWLLCHLFGAFPVVLDRHVIEFFPQFFPDGKCYGKTLGVETFSVEQTIDYGDRIFSEMREAALSPHPLDQGFFSRISGEHEQVIEIIGCLRSGRREVYSVNLPNTGQVPNLPADSVIECPAITEGGSLRALSQGPLPLGIAGTLATRLLWTETVVEAALEGSREKFVQALILDGWVNSLETAIRLADELLSAHAQYLPQFRA
jgi:alpha-galactosidase